jgi:hypothetical protein
VALAQYFIFPLMALFAWLKSYDWKYRSLICCEKKHHSLVEKVWLKANREACRNVSSLWSSGFCWSEAYDAWLAWDLSFYLIWPLGAMACHNNTRLQYIIGH